MRRTAIAPVSLAETTTKSDDDDEEESAFQLVSSYMPNEKAVSKRRRQGFVSTEDDGGGESLFQLHADDTTLVAGTTALKTAPRMTLSSDPDTSGAGGEPMIEVDHVRRRRLRRTKPEELQRQFKPPFETPLPTEDVQRMVEWQRQADDYMIQLQKQPWYRMAAMMATYAGVSIDEMVVVERYNDIQMPPAVVGMPQATTSPLNRQLQGGRVVDDGGRQSVQQRPQSAPAVVRQQQPQAVPVVRRLFVEPIPVGGGNGGGDVPLPRSPQQGGGGDRDAFGSPLRVNPNPGRPASRGAGDDDDEDDDDEDEDEVERPSTQARAQFLPSGATYDEAKARLEKDIREALGRPQIDKETLANFDRQQRALYILGKSEGRIRQPSTRQSSSWASLPRATGQAQKKPACAQSQALALTMVHMRFPSTLGTATVDMFEAAANDCSPLFSLIAASIYSRGLFEGGRRPLRVYDYSTYGQGVGYAMSQLRFARVSRNGREVEMDLRAVALQRQERASRSPWCTRSNRYGSTSAISAAGNGGEFFGATLQRGLLSTPGFSPLVGRAAERSPYGGRGVFR
jgi:negative regulator of sigma E activity